MEKYIKDALKWLDENQNNSNARELFTNKTKEAEEFFSPFYENIAGKFNNQNTLFLYIYISFSAYIAEMELNNTNPIRPPPRTPKSGRK